MKLLRPLSLFVFLVLCSCEKPPQQEVDSAARALELAAKDPDVITYAPDSLRIAQEKMAAVLTEMDSQSKKAGFSRRYDAARALLEDVLAAAESTQSDAQKAKEQVKTDAASLLDGLEAEAISSYEVKLWTAKRIRGIKLDTDLLSLAGSVRASISDARADLAIGSYASAMAKAMTIQGELAEGESRIADAVRLARGR